MSISPHTARGWNTIDNIRRQNQSSRMPSRHHNVRLHHLHHSLLDTHRIHRTHFQFKYWSLETNDLSVMYQNPLLQEQPQCIYLDILIDSTLSNWSTELHPQQNLPLRNRPTKMSSTSVTPVTFKQSTLSPSVAKPNMESPHAISNSDLTVFAT